MVINYCRVVLDITLSFSSLLKTLTLSLKYMSRLVIKFYARITVLLDSAQTSRLNDQICVLEEKICKNYFHRLILDSRFWTRQT